MPKKKTMSAEKPGYLKIRACEAYRAGVAEMARAAKDDDTAALIHRLLLKEAKRLKIALPPR